MAILTIKALEFVYWARLNDTYSALLMAKTAYYIQIIPKSTEPIYKPN